MPYMKLSELHEQLTKEEREAFASRVGIKPAYLWQLATQWNGKKPSLDLLKKIADADARLTVAGLVEEFTGGAVSLEAMVATVEPPGVPVCDIAGPDKQGA
jgi:hypothetical protein